jgi:hypothetical protein
VFVAHLPGPNRNPVPGTDELVGPLEEWRPTPTADEAHAVRLIVCKCSSRQRPTSVAVRRPSWSSRPIHLPRFAVVPKAGTSVWSIMPASPFKARKRQVQWSSSILRRSADRNGRPLRRWAKPTRLRWRTQAGPGRVPSATSDVCRYGQCADHSHPASPVIGTTCRNARYQGDCGAPAALVIGDRATVDDSLLTNQAGVHMIMHHRTCETVTSRASGRSRTLVQPDPVRDLLDLRMNHLRMLVQCNPVDDLGPRRKLMPRQDR